MKKRILVTFIFGLLTWFGGMATALACSPAGASIGAVYPSDGAEISPMAAFSVSVGGLGDVADAELSRSDGTEIPLSQSRSFSYGAFGKFVVFEPDGALSPGDYTFHVVTNTQGRPTPGGNTEETRSYEVREDDSSSSPEKPSGLALSTATLEGEQPIGTCQTGSDMVRAEFNRAGGDVAYYVVRYSTDKQDGAATFDLVGDSAPDDDQLVSEELLGFTPTCITVTAFTADRTASSSSTTCSRKICADGVSRDFRYQRNWKDLPRCQKDDGGNDSGGGGSDDENIGWSDTVDDSSSGPNAGCGCGQSQGPPPTSLALILIALFALGRFGNTNARD